MSWAGMRGIVSLAIALALPYTLGDQPFPQRSVTIFFTFCVVFVTLVLAGPHPRSADRMAGRDRDQPRPAARNGAAHPRPRSRHRALTRRWGRAESRRSSAKSPIASSKSIEQRIDVLRGKATKTRRSKRRENRIDRAVQKEALAAERQAIVAMRSAGEIPDDIYQLDRVRSRLGDAAP